MGALPFAMKKVVILLGVIGLLIACQGEVSISGDKEEIIHVNGISLEKTLILVEGETGVLTPTITPDNATDKTVIWNSTDERIVTVADGLVKGVKAGSATVTAETKDGGMRAECCVTVKPFIYPSVTLDAIEVSAVSALLRGKAIHEQPILGDFSFGFHLSHLSDLPSTDTIEIEVNDADIDNNYTASISSLSPSTTYYYCAYICRNGQYTCGDSKSFTTKDVSSMLETLDASDIEATSATLNAKLDLTEVRYKTLSYGFYWGDSEVSLDSSLQGGEINNGTFSVNLTTLPHNTQYWYKAFAVIDNQKYYGEGKTFTTAIIAVGGVSLNRNDYTFHTIGETFQLVASVMPEDATDISIEWSSSDGTVATVDQNGLVTAVGNGTATITVVTADQCKTASCDVTVAQSVTGVTLDKSEYIFHSIGDSFQLAASVAPEDAADKTLEWASSDEAVATVDQNGLVTAVGNGTATIIVSTIDQGKTAECEITVEQWVTSVTLSNTELSMNEGEEYVLTVSVAPDNAYDKSVNWESMDTRVATVDSNGKVTAIKKGIAHIYVRAASRGYIAARCIVTVIRPVSQIDLDKTAIVLYRGKDDVTETITATISPSSASNTGLEWSSSDTSIATVSDGVVTGKAAGTVTITASAKDGSGVKASCNVEVKQYVTAISLVDPSLTLIEGNSASVAVDAVYPSNAFDKSYSWSSLDESIVMVDANGLVTALNKGMTAVRATANDGGGGYADCVVTVKSPCPDGAVDLGLSVYWASCNLSEKGFVNSPVEFGDCYAWGETEIKEFYDWSNYKYGSDYVNKQFLKYSEDDEKTVLETGPDGDDVASIKLAGTWRMPSIEEFEELIENCFWEWKTSSDGFAHDGFLVMAPDGNSIFFPATGTWGMNSNAGPAGRYWSSSLSGVGGIYAKSLFFAYNNSDQNTRYHATIFFRSNGLSIRPVLERP